MQNTTLCYIEKNGKYLMLHRVKKENDANRDKWIGIGGHFEEKESPYDCVIREVYEETGLTIKSPSYRGIVTFVSDKYETEQMHLFHCTDYDGSLTDCDEGELDWLDKSRLREYPLWEGDYVFMEMLDTHPDFFSLKLIYEGDRLKEYIIK